MIRRPPGSTRTDTPFPYTTLFRSIFLGFRGVGSEITEQRKSSEKIAQLARYDTLTNLPNRLHLTESLAAAMQDMERWNTRCAFLMIDLDRFKAVNDTLGHPIGDRLLARVAERRSEEHTSELQSLMRNSYAVFCLKKKNKNSTDVYTLSHDL